MGKEVGGKSSVLRPKEDKASQDAFWPLFNARNDVIEQQGTVTEAMFAAIRRGDKGSEAEHRNRLEALKLEEERLSRELRTHQVQ